MKRLIYWSILFTFLAAACPAFAARGSRGMPAFKGDWHPVVGSGAVYQMKQKNQPAMDWEVAVVGKEEGGYWVETRMATPEQMVMKMLIVPPGGIKRTIMKAGTEPAIEMPVMRGHSAPETNLKESAKLIGREQVSTPAGNFACDHYQSQEGKITTDVWIAEQVSPYGLVKMESKDTTMVLSKIVKGATTKITETPQKFEMPKGMPNLSDLMRSVAQENQ